MHGVNLCVVLNLPVDFPPELYGFLAHTIAVLWPEPASFLH